MRSRDVRLRFSPNRTGDPAIDCYFDIIQGNLIKLNTMLTIGKYSKRKQQEAELLCRRIESDIRKVFNMCRPLFRMFELQTGQLISLNSKLAEASMRRGVAVAADRASARARANRAQKNRQQLMQT